MLTYRDMQIGMERVKDARRADAQRRQCEMVQVEDGNALTTALATIGSWLVREPVALRQIQPTPTPAHKQE